MVATFVVFGARLWRDNTLQPRDWIWLRKIRDVVENREENLPEVGRYNAGQKLLYFTIVVCLLGLLLSRDMAHLFLGVLFHRGAAFRFPVARPFWPSC